MNYQLDEIDLELLNETLEGKKYLEYYEKFKSKPCFYGIGMPDFLETYGDLTGLYDECIIQNKKWEELLKWNEKEYFNPDNII
jgi:hypothetical protein